MLKNVKVPTIYIILLIEDKMIYSGNDIICFCYTIYKYRSYLSDMFQNKFNINFVDGVEN